VEKHPEIYQLLLKNGHQTGNHSYHHIKGWQTNNTTYFDEVDACSKLVNSNLYRPPHGQITKTQARYLKKKYKIVMWSNLSGDYNATLSEEQCFRNSVKNLKSGAIIVFHDSLKARDRMFPVLSRFIEYCINQGFSFGTL
jgi:peptidoglycan/xylan/chitin deacetylase (PgdA/CDA1 family)